MSAAKASYLSRRATQEMKVRILYRRALKWTVHCRLFHHSAAGRREKFEATRHVEDIELNDRIIAAGETSYNKFTGTMKHHCWEENRSCSSTDFEIISSNKAIKFYCETGKIELARPLFDKMPVRTIVSWNTMLTGYSKWRMINEGLGLISLMHRSDIKLNETTFSVSLSICGRAQSLINGKQIHGLVLKSEHLRFKNVGCALLYMYATCFEIGGAENVFDEFHRENNLLWSVMLVGYVECNLMSEALKVFGGMPSRGVVEWTALISGYAKSDDGCKKALELFKRMREKDEIVPNELTLDCVIRTCGRLEDLWCGMMIHGLVIKVGFGCECCINGALIFFYCSCELMNDAKKVSRDMSNPGLNNSNELIGGFLNFGNIKEAESIFSIMVERNSISYNLMIKGYAMCGRVNDSERLFMQMPTRTLTSSNTMISVYMRNGDISKAFEIFEKVKGKGNPVTWNAMISGFVQNNHHESAIELYLTMHRSSIRKTRSTFPVLFQACACLGSLQQGQLLHAHLEKTPFSSNVYVGTALIDMYSKCGSIAYAMTAFSCTPSSNVATWTALISGHASHGLASDAISFFNLMLRRGISPNAATFVAVLSACTRAGLVDEAKSFFILMKERYHITPMIEHFTCIVNLLGRVGLVREAEKFIRRMPVKADRIVLISLLHDSSFWMDTGVGERVAGQMFALDPKSSSAHIIMSDMYSKSGKWGQKLMTRDALKGLGINKAPGCSWINVNNP